MVANCQTYTPSYVGRVDRDMALRTRYHLHRVYSIKMDAHRHEVLDSIHENCNSYIAREIKKRNWLYYLWSMALPISIFFFAIDSHFETKHFKVTNAV